MLIRNPRGTVANLENTTTTSLSDWLRHGITKRVTPCQQLLELKLRDQGIL